MREIAFFGSSLVSAYWNGAATYYRGLLHALARRGHRITFYEPDAFERQRHRDLADPDWARVVVYPPDEGGAARALEEARRADVLVKASGVGVLDGWLERAVLEVAGPATTVAFWDVDAPATLERLEDRHDPFAALVPRYHVIFTYGGGAPVVSAYLRHGARRCVPVYSALDPATHHPVEPDRRFACDLVFLGNRHPDRDARVRKFFFGAAGRLPERSFILGGNGWADVPRPTNVIWIGHVYTREHNALNCSATAVLNICRDSMARFGFSPATRVFEAAGAGACVISDAWEGIASFLEPGKEVLVADDGEAVAVIVDELTPERARTIGRAARRRILAAHTYAHRAALVDAVLDGLQRLEAAAP